MITKTRENEPKFYVYYNMSLEDFSYKYFYDFEEALTCYLWCSVGGSYVEEEDTVGKSLKGVLDVMNGYIFDLQNQYYDRSRSDVFPSKEAYFLKYTIQHARLELFLKAKEFNVHLSEYRGYSRKTTIGFLDLRKGESYEY